jgi:glycosyltransferase involved in cell wall biosynthesis
LILGFYYHIPCSVRADGKIGMPSFQGLFVDSLARRVEHLYCFLHVQKVDDLIDYWLSSSNVTVVSLGNDAPAYIKAFFPGRFLTADVVRYADQCDRIIIRGPSPLLHHFREITSRDKLVYFIVGSYKEGLKHSFGKWHRRYPIRLLLRYIDLKQGRVLKGSNILVNSQTSAYKYSSIAKRVGLVYTTTLSHSDFFIRNDTCQFDTIKLMFIGRLDWAKGLRELTGAFMIVNKEYRNIELHFVSWEDNPMTPVQKEIECWAQDNDLREKVNFHGKKAAGSKLLEYYRSGDLYILPSYHEGFPRTIWEALASSLPVITTTVGSISEYLTHKKSAYLIPPHDETALANAILELISNQRLRQGLIKEGLERVKEITLEEQSKRIIKFINNE